MFSDGDLITKIVYNAFCTNSNMKRFPTILRPLCMLEEHYRMVTEFDWSPGNPNCLATGSVDG